MTAIVISRLAGRTKEVMSARCDACKHWGSDQVDWLADSIGFRHCTIIRPRWDIQDDIEPRSEPDDEAAGDNWIAARKEHLRATRAYVVDGSEYRAALWTGPDFSCALFEEK